MQFIDLPLSTPAMQLACDDLLLQTCEQDPALEVLRIWKPETYFVVTGYTNRILQEVNVQACVAAGIPLYRRSTGGGTVVQGPGCLNYTLVLPLGRSEALDTIGGTNAYVLERIAAALQPLLPERIERRGHTDLVLGDRKFSGNAQRRTQHAVLFHGVFLTGFAIRIIERLLPLPSTQPDYRAGRSHTDFLCNLPLDAGALVDALRTAWNAHDLHCTIPLDKIRSLAQTRYLNHEWTFRF